MSGAGGFQGRLALVGCAFGAAFVLLGMRAAQLTIWRGEQYRKQAEKQHHRLVTIEVGVPPGCSINRAGITGADVARVEQGEGRLILYLNRVGARKSQRFEIPFTARYGLDVSTGMSKAYEYYTPEAATLLPPSRLRATR